MNKNELVNSSVRYKYNLESYQQNQIKQEIPEQHGIGIGQSRWANKKNIECEIKGIFMKGTRIA